MFSSYVGVRFPLTAVRPVRFPIGVLVKVLARVVSSVQLYTMYVPLHIGRIHGSWEAKAGPGWSWCLNFGRQNRSCHSLKGHLAKSSILRISLCETVLKMICELIGVHSRPQMCLLRIGPYLCGVLVKKLDTVGSIFQKRKQVKVYGSVTWWKALVVRAPSRCSSASMELVGECDDFLMSLPPIESE